MYTGGANLDDISNNWFPLKISEKFLQNNFQKLFK